MVIIILSVYKVYISFASGQCYSSFVCAKGYNSLVILKGHSSFASAYDIYYCHKVKHIFIRTRFSK